MFSSAVLAPLAELFVILINILRVFGCQKTKLEAGAALQKSCESSDLVEKRKHKELKATN